jgi:transcriptional regulator with XRE-family HTH domain
MAGEGSFAAALRAARHAAGLTLEELAEASGVSVRALSDMERGRALGPQRRTVGSVADALKLDGAPGRVHVVGEGGACPVGVPCGRARSV